MKQQQPPDAIPQTALYPMFRGERVIEFVEKEVPTSGFDVTSMAPGINST